MSQYISAVVLVSMAKHRVLAYFALAEGIANLVLSIILVQKVGLIGVAIGTVIPQLITTTCFLPLYTVRALGLRYSEYVSRAIVRPFIAAVPAALAAYGLSLISFNLSWLSFAAKALAVAAVFAFSALFICFTPAQRESLVSNLSPFGLASTPGAD
jgi:O-antigen/teichoic acid export membrane protein